MGGYEDNLSGGKQLPLSPLLCSVSSSREQSGVTARLVREAGPTFRHPPMDPTS